MTSVEQKAKHSLDNTAFTEFLGKVRKLTWVTFVFYNWEEAEESLALLVGQAFGSFIQRGSAFEDLQFYLTDEIIEICLGVRPELIRLHKKVFAASLATLVKAYLELFKASLLAENVVQGKGTQSCDNGTQACAKGTSL